MDLGAKVDHLPRVETVSIVDLGPKAENDRQLHTFQGWILASIVDLGPLGLRASNSL